MNSQPEKNADNVNNANENENSARLLPERPVLIAQESPGDFIAQKAFEAVVFVAGVGATAIYNAWESGAEGRRQVGQWIEEGLRNIGQYSQERVEQLDRFISEKSLERKEPGRPTAENTGGEFQPPKKGATTGQVQEGPYAGKEGWVDSQGKIWVPTNGRAAHGGEHYDRQNRDGSDHDNVYPGGTVRSSIDGPLYAFANPDLQKQADKLIQTLESANPALKSQQTDVVAALMAAGAKAGFDPKLDIGIVQSNKDANVLIAVQGEGPAALRAEPVNIASLTPGAAQNIFDQLNKNSTQIASATVDQPEQNKFRSA